MRSYRVRLTVEQRTAASWGGERILMCDGRGGARSDIEDVSDGVVGMPSPRSVRRRIHRPARGQHGATGLGGRRSRDSPVWSSRPYARWLTACKPPMCLFLLGRGPRIELLQAARDVDHPRSCRCIAQPRFLAGSRGHAAPPRSFDGHLRGRTARRRGRQSVSTGATFGWGHPDLRVATRKCSHPVSMLERACS